MTAGLDIKCKIWRITFPTPDDDVGGANVSGTVVYDNVYGRIREQKTTPLLLEQGLEIDTLFQVEVRPVSMIIYERDEFELIYPLNHWDYGKRYRIIQVQHTSMHPNDSRSFINLTLRRSERAHVNQ
jgi:hypothetical protein